MRTPLRIAAVALAAAALAGCGGQWTVAVRRAEVKGAPGAYVRPAEEMKRGESFEGEQEGDWVRIKEKGRSGFVHRSALAAEGERLRDPDMAFAIMGTVYPDDVMDSDPVATEWMRNPVVHETGAAPHAWGLEEFRANGGLGAGK